MKVYWNSFKVNFKYIVNFKFLWIFLFVADFIIYGFYQYALSPYNKYSWRYSFTFFVLVSFISLPLLMYPLVSDTSRKIAANLLSVRVSIKYHYITVAANYFIIMMFVFILSNLIYLLINSYTHRMEYDIKRLVITIGFAAMFLILCFAVFTSLVVICNQFITAYLIYILLCCLLLMLSNVKILPQYLPFVEIKDYIFEFIIDKRLFLYWS